MLTTSCPKCEKEVTVPATATAESRVRCPLCSEEYSLEPVFADMPPLLELLDAPSANGAQVADAEADAAEVGEQSGGMFDFDQGEASGGGDDAEGDVALADPEETVPKSAGFDFGESSSAPSTGGAATATRKPRSRKKSSPVKAIIGVIIGGLFAIPIAQLTLWYLPGGWDIEQRDPMGVGRKLSETFVSFIIPSWVAEPEDADNTALVDPSTPTPQTPTDEDEEESGFPAVGSGVGDKGNGNGNNSRGGNNQAGGNQNNGNGNANANNANNGNNAEGNDEPDNGGDGNGNEQGSDQSPSPVKDAPSFTTAELSAELKLLKDEAQRFAKVSDQEVDFDERRLILKDFYTAAGRLAEAVTFVEGKAGGHREHINPIFSDAAESAEKRALIAMAANPLARTV